MNKNYDNPFDDREFFENYLAHRAKNNSYNDLLEQPIIVNLLGNLQGQDVLDLGCGYGALTPRLVEAGAKSILGTDVSYLMIEEAKRRNSFFVDSGMADYKVLPAKETRNMNTVFDTVVSCLCLHYIEDLSEIFGQVYDVLRDGGRFVFSMEHPLDTACREKHDWIYNGDGEYYAYVLESYSVQGERIFEWLGKRMRKYHHTFASIMNGLLRQGFRIDRILEPKPTPELIAAAPKMAREMHRPAFLVVRCGK